jgi:hypothetical protein
MRLLTLPLHAWKVDTHRCTATYISMWKCSGTYINIFLHQHSLASMLLRPAQVDARTGEEVRVDDLDPMDSDDAE